MNWSHIEKLVPWALREPDFQFCLEAFPLLEQAKTTPQQFEYHQEGDVWTHTKMVVRALMAGHEYQALPRNEQVIVFMAALLHDIAKASTTVIDPDTGRIRQPGHSRRGAIDARIALWDAGCPFDLREAVCGLITAHQVPFHLLADTKSAKPPEFTLRKLSWQMNTRLLAVLAEADMRGRIVDNPQPTLDNIELFRQMAFEDGCFGVPRAFATPNTRVRYFRGAQTHPDYALWARPGSRVTVMSGMPASGKNTWVEQAAHCKALPVISFDDAREELGVRHGSKDAGKAVHLTIDRAKALLREQAPFVWNATNLNPETRKRTLDLLLDYDAEVEIVYLEETREELLARNGKRDTTLRNKDLVDMLFKWEPPLATEAHSVRYEIAGKPQEMAHLAGHAHRPGGAPEEPGAQKAPRERHSSA